jgi:lipopolysaccharide transport system permease protein
MFRAAFNDIHEAFRKRYLVAVLGWQDVAARYKRSKVGAFWITLNMGVMIATLALVFGALLKQSFHEFLPYVAVGLIVWSFISTNLIESCTAFTDSGGIILQVRLPLFIHIARVLWKNIIILGHNVLIVPLVLLFSMYPVSVSAFLAVPGFVILLLNLLWIMLVLSVSCARYRDITQIVQNAVQVAFYLTPVIWSAGIVNERLANMLVFNPFYSFISIVRDPILGSMPDAQSWIISVSLAVIGWGFALWLYGKKLKNVPYWM